MRIGVDMDGTVVDFTTASFERVEELYGIHLTHEDALIPKTAELVWERMTPEQQSPYKNNRELYDDICDDGFFFRLPAFPGAIDAVKKLANAGHEIVWITKVLNWHRTAPEKDRWLKKYFSDIEYDKIMVDSTRAKRFADVDIMVDDDPHVLEVLDGPIPIMIRQPWNANIRGKYIYEVDTMVEAADIILSIQEHYDYISDFWTKKGTV
jgi:5'(3')-deoxyribonucleotidase